MPAVAKPPSEPTAAEAPTAEEATTATATEEPQLLPEDNEHIGMPVYLEGTRGRVKSGPYAGRMVFITGHTFDTTEDYLQFNTAGHPMRYFAKIKSYVVGTRDSRNEQLEITPDQFEEL